VVGGCVLVYARTHTQSTWVLDVSPGVGQTPGEPKESRSTKVQYTCGPYMCAQYICLLICWAVDFDYLGYLPFFLQHVFSFEESRRCDDNRQTTVIHFGKNKRLHLESSKQIYYIISLRATIKANFSSLAIAQS